jgi:hypothetical protein
MRLLSLQHHVQKYITVHLFLPVGTSHEFMSGSNYWKILLNTKIIFSLAVGLPKSLTQSFLGQVAWRRFVSKKPAKRLKISAKLKKIIFFKSGEGPKIRRFSEKDKKCLCLTIT